MYLNTNTRTLKRTHTALDTDRFSCCCCMSILIAHYGLANIQLTTTNLILSKYFLRDASNKSKSTIYFKVSKSIRSSRLEKKQPHNLGVIPTVSKQCIVCWFVVVNTVHFDICEFMESDTYDQTISCIQQIQCIEEIGIISIKINYFHVCEIRKLSNFNILNYVICYCLKTEQRAYIFYISAC